jgi:hypothetical protein
MRATTSLIALTSFQQVVRIPTTSAMVERRLWAIGAADTKRAQINGFGALVAAHSHNYCAGKPFLASIDEI